MHQLCVVFLTIQHMREGDRVDPVCCQGRVDTARTDKWRLETTHNAHDSLDRHGSGRKLLERPSRTVISLQKPLHGVTHNSHAPQIVFKATCRQRMKDKAGAGVWRLETMHAAHHNEAGVHGSTISSV
jgi:hypothetical protein